MTIHVNRELLDGALDAIRQSPQSDGVVKMIVCRPAVGEREVLPEAELSVELGLVGDNWAARWSGREAQRQRHLDMQINLMNSRVIDSLTAGDMTRWPLAGDQLFVDFDLSEDNLPAGTKIKVGEAVLEVTSEPHLGCSKFKQRFGRDAVLFVNSDLGKQLKLRGINARVITPGVVTNGGVISKLAPFLDALRSFGFANGSAIPIISDSENKPRGLPLKAGHAYGFLFAPVVMLPVVHALEFLNWYVVAEEGVPYRSYSFGASLTGLVGAMIAYPTVLLYGVPVWVLLSRTGELTYWRVILASLLPGIFLSAGVGSLQLLPSMEIYSILLVSVIWFINKRLTVKAQEI